MFHVTIQFYAANRKSYWRNSVLPRRDLPRMMTTTCCTFFLLFKLVSLVVQAVLGQEQEQEQETISRVPTHVHVVAILTCSKGKVPLVNSKEHASNACAAANATICEHASIVTRDACATNATICEHASIVTRDACATNATPSPRNAKQFAGTCINCYS